LQLEHDHLWWRRHQPDKVRSYNPRYNDIFTYEFEKRKWTKIETDRAGQDPQPRTFHRAVIFGNIMYIIGGFDGQRLNDMHHIALPTHLYEED
jgi:hypothetical protein